MPLPNLTLRTLTPTVGTTKGSALSFAEMDTNLINLAGANIQITAGGTTTNIALNSGFTLSAGTGITISQSAGNVTITGEYGNTQVASYLAGSTTQGSITLTGNIAGNVAGFAIGYRDMPQVAGGNVTLALTDAGKHFYNSTATPTTITIPTFANVAFGNGTVVSVVNQTTSNIAVALQSGVSLYLGGNATSAARTITSHGVATLLKVNTNTWFINGTGVV